MGAKNVSIMVIISICLFPMVVISWVPEQYYYGSASIRPAPYADRSCPQLTLSDLNDPYVAIAGEAIWEGESTCGQKFSITCTGSGNELLPNPCKPGCVVVTIVEHCLTSVTCGLTGNLTPNTFQLSQEAFLEISCPSPNITISYTRVY